MRYETKNFVFERQLALQRECIASAGLARVFPIIIVTIIVVSVVVTISVIISLIVITMATIMIVISWDFNKYTASSGLARAFTMIITIAIITDVVTFIIIVVIVIIIKTSDFNKFAASAGLGSQRQRGESGVRQLNRDWH